MDKDKTRIKIAIVDSGVEQHDLFKGVCVSGNDEIGYHCTDDFSDEIGHGTMVKNIIASRVTNCEFYITKVFNNEDDISEQKLIFALKYLQKKIKPDIIHLSLGITFCNDITHLKTICDSLADDGTLIIAAFDNNGAISYPAAFDNVIGVGSNKRCIKTTDFVFYENSPINIEAIGVAQRLLGLCGKYYDVIGSSFSAPYITSLIADYISNTNKKDLNNVLEYLRRKAHYVFDSPNVETFQSPFKIKKAILFPYNKEIITLLRNHQYLTFEIAGIYDIKHLRNTGKTILDGRYTVEMVEAIDWNSDFDTVILGHMKEISSIMKKDINRFIVKQCEKYNKKIYSFDPIIPDAATRQYVEQFTFTPRISINNVPLNNLGKLYQIGKPIVCLAGTSSKQGKFSLQMQIISNLKAKGCKTGHLSTEPSGYLLGADIVFPIGYNAEINVNTGEEIIAAANSALSQIEKKNPDIIFTGLQSQTIPTQVCNLNDMVLYNHYFLLGVNPDATILVVNVFDDIDYIKRTINYLENIIICEVIAVVIFPIEKTFMWNTIGNLSVHADLVSLQKTKDYIRQNVDKPTYIMDDINDVDDLCDTIINYFRD